MDSVFIVDHLNVHPSGHEDLKCNGVYRTYELAHAAVERLKTQPGFCDKPELINPEIDEDEAGFYISEYKLDKDHWTEGYVTMTAENS